MSHDEIRGLTRRRFIGGGNVQTAVFDPGALVAANTKRNYEQDSAPGGAADPGRSLRFAAESYATMDALRG